MHEHEAMLNVFTRPYRIVLSLIPVHIDPVQITPSQVCLPVGAVLARRSIGAAAAFEWGAQGVHIDGTPPQSSDGGCDIQAWVWPWGQLLCQRLATDRQTHCFISGVNACVMPS